MSGFSGLPTRSSGRLPNGVLSLDYLKFLQLSVNPELADARIRDAAALEHAMAAVRSGSMRTEHPAMKVFFDGCQFWLASHFHRYEAARRLGARHQEFWCEIQPGSKDDALRYASKHSGIPCLCRDHSCATG
ncbi:hypothetical protein F4827_003889 [Paraburkholderia bannensis]|uniref:Uncharacterized protein n=1 Tax=Paraburkholderia bannensis TaxID=765414 RepID=A0A7W9U170_9BURK|nr:MULTISPECIES: hypothetical protein [Paraburkholderia]MBB3259015.1 hypothetical protein [Paraburkholderia sp. WP4_3_2]MBB6104030.1 hypothetical protein [Paraburkholderia bannensis]